MAWRITTWWKRCIEGLRGGAGCFTLFHMILRIFIGRGVCLVLFCLVVLLVLVFVVFCVCLCFWVAVFFQWKFCIQFAFHSFEFPVVDRQCLVLDRQCRKKKLLAAAWVDPGRSALQSAEQRCQRRYGRIHRFGWMSCMTKTCKKAMLKNKRLHTERKRKRKPATDWKPGLQKRALVKSYRQHLRRSKRWNGIGRRWLWWNPKEAPTPEPVCKPQNVEDMLVNKCYKCWPLIEYFIWNTNLWEVKCEVNPPASTSPQQKWRNGGETVVKRETAPTSESAQFILAWRSKDSVESARNSQCEAQSYSRLSGLRFWLDLPRINFGTPSLERFVVVAGLGHFNWRCGT